MDFDSEAGLGDHGGVLVGAREGWCPFGRQPMVRVPENRLERSGRAAVPDPWVMPGSASGGPLADIVELQAMFASRLLAARRFLAVVILGLLAEAWALATPTAAGDKDGTRVPLPLLSGHLGLSQYFDIVWQSVQRSATVYNPAAEEWPEAQTQRLTINLKLRVLTTRNLIGICTTPVLTRVTDPEGKPIELGLAEEPSYRHYQRWHEQTRVDSQGRRYTDLAPIHFTLQADLSGVGKLPATLGCVEGYFYALFAKDCQYRDIPFKKSDDWVELEPGLRIRVAEAYSQNRQFRYRIETQDTRDPSERFSGFFDPQRHRLPEKLLSQRQLLDSQGKPLPIGHGGLLSRPGGSGSGSGNERFGDVKSIRFVYAIQPYERKVPIRLENIPAPRL